MRVQGGEERVHGRFIILLHTENNLPESRFGITVSRKTGNAVTRSRIKRKLREIQRLARSRVATGSDIVVIARRPASGALYKELEHEYLELARKSGLLQGETED